MSSSNASSLHPEISVVTITFNEADVIHDFLMAVCGFMRGAGKPFEVVVVDDESPDGTGFIVEAVSREFPEVRLVTRIGRRGIGSAYWHGIEKSRGKIVVTMDADFSHPPDRIMELARHAAPGHLAIGSRFLRRGDFSSRWYRVLPTRSINLWHRMFLRSAAHDHTNGFLAVNRDTLRRLIDEAGACGIMPFDRVLYGLSLVVFARRLGITVVEVPTPYIFRTKGETKIRILPGVRLLVEEWLDSLALAPHRKK